MKKLSGTSVIYLGYVFFLLGFVSLGLFVAALATGSPLAVVGGIALVAAFGAAVAAFRFGARTAANIWSEPVTATAVDRYLAAYRAEQPADDPESADGPEQLSRAA